MKAIKITQALKDANVELFKNYAIDSIRRFNSIPKSFYSLNHNAGQRTDGYHTLNNTIHEADGFFDFVEPVIDEATQKLGVIYFDENAEVFRYTIEAKTQQEQDDHAQQLEDNDTYGSKQSTRESNGNIMVRRFFAYVHRQVGNGNLTQARAVKASNYMRDGLTFLSFGEMELAKNSFNTIDLTSETQANRTAIQEVIDLGVQKIQTYLNNE